MTLWVVTAGESHHSEMAIGRTRLGEECQLKAREGIWVILSNANDSNKETCLDILEWIDLDEVRPQYYRSKFEKRRA
ncbi:hypothetical protein GCM10009658_44130 [Planotetraspora silvatica]